MSNPPTEASVYLRQLAARLAQPYIASLGARAVLLTGSTAEGISDYYSDLDMTAYYDALPDDEALAAAREQNGAASHMWLGQDRAGGGVAEAYRVNAIECQIGHATIAAWERDIATVLEQHDVTSPLQKALTGVLIGYALHGEEHIARWKAQLAAYPDTLARAMVTHYLAFFPLWYMQERFAARDAMLWRYQLLVEGAQHILGVLAGLNRLYFTTFQFKRMRSFIHEMRVAPPDLAARIEALFALDARGAAVALEALVGEVVALVEQHMPDIDTTRVRRRLGQRDQPWQPISH